MHSLSYNEEMHSFLYTHAALHSGWKYSKGKTKNSINYNNIKLMAQNFSSLTGS